MADSFLFFCSFSHLFLFLLHFCPAFFLAGRFTFWNRGTPFTSLFPLIPEEFVLGFSECVLFPFPAPFSFHRFFPQSLRLGIR